MKVIVILQKIFYILLRVELQILIFLVSSEYGTPLRINPCKSYPIILARLRIFNKLVIAHLNINSLRNKIELLAEKSKRNAEILLIFKLKIDESLFDNQFKIYGFSNLCGLEPIEVGVRISL